MKVGILTQPLYTNYGGLVQCYALQAILKRMGHDTVVLQREFNRQYTFRGAAVYYAKHVVKLLLGRQSSWHYRVDKARRDYIAQNTHQFIEKNIHQRSLHCYSTEQLIQEAERYQLDAIVVGSDQVWRPDYSPCQTNYFLDFLPDTSPVRRISYAASFGGDEWAFSEELTATCRLLLHRFAAISVREQSAVRLCKEHFDVEAVQVLDPTLLLNAKDYVSLIGEHKPKRGGLFCYILDQSQDKSDFIHRVEEQAQLTAFHSMPELPDSTYNLYDDIQRCVYPPVEDWLSAFDEAEMVLTDSFHGTAFSIIFNKPFWVIGNEGRGMARFESLLSLFGLKDRLITPDALNDIDILAPIDWQGVNEQRKSQQALSMQFIANSLT